MSRSRDAERHLAQAKRTILAYVRGVNEPPPYINTPELKSAWYAIAQAKDEDQKKRALAALTDWAYCIRDLEDRS